MSSNGSASDNCFSSTSTQSEYPVLLFPGGMNVCEPVFPNVPMLVEEPVVGLYQRAQLYINDTVARGFCRPHYAAVQGLKGSESRSNALRDGSHGT
jgi:hypothetical protein